MTRASSVALPLELRPLLAGLASVQVQDDQQWILALLRRRGATVAHMLWRMLGSEQDVLDAYQTTVCKLIAQGKDAIGSNRSGYLYRTAINAGIEILRVRKRRRHHWPTVIDVQSRRQIERNQADSHAGSAAFDQRETMNQMRRAIEQLPPHLRDVVILRELAELPYDQVATILHITRGTARLYRRQAIVRLAEQIGQEADQ